MWQKIQRQVRNQEIGIQMQEMVAIKLEEFFPSPPFKIYSNGTHGADLIIYFHEIKLFECEVKTAIEVFIHHFKNHGRWVNQIRRGMFSIKPDQLNMDFWSFVIRFVDKDLKWNGDVEIWWAMGKNVSEYLNKQTINCINYKLNIDKMLKIGAVLDFIDIKDQLF